MAPVLKNADEQGRAGALQVSKNALGDLLLIVALVIAATLPLLLLMEVADWLWTRAGSAEIDASTGLWVEITLSLGAMCLPLAWIARRWRCLEIPLSGTPETGVALAWSAAFWPRAFPIRLAGWASGQGTNFFPATQTTWSSCCKDRGYFHYWYW